MSNARYASLFSCITLIIVLMLGQPRTTYLMSQTNEEGGKEDRVLEKVKGFNPPVSVISVKTKKGPVELNKKFSAEDDWFKGLTVAVRNDSGKAVTYVSLHLHFPRPEGQENERDYGFFLEYGVNPLWLRQKKMVAPPATPILPGEKVEIQLRDDKYDILLMSLEKLKYAKSIKALRINVEMLGFADETIWLGDKMYMQDQGEPGKVIPLDNSNPYQPGRPAKFLREPGSKVFSGPWRADASFFYSPPRGLRSATCPSRRVRDAGI